MLTLGLLHITFIGSCVNLYQSWGDHTRIYSASLLVVLTFSTLLASLYARSFALKAQDRAIRAEEQLRHYVLTGKLLDPTPHRPTDRRPEVRAERGIRGTGPARRRPESLHERHQAGGEELAAPIPIVSEFMRWPRAARARRRR